jgi:hypothetical protein
MGGSSLFPAIFRLPFLTCSLPKSSLSYLSKKRGEPHFSDDNKDIVIAPVAANEYNGEIERRLIQD